jgi:hypothetical protein
VIPAVLFSSVAVVTTRLHNSDEDAGFFLVRRERDPELAMVATVFGNVLRDVCCVVTFRTSLLSQFMIYHS